MTQAIIGVVSTLIASGLLLLGTKFVARQSRVVGEQQVAVDQRKVDQETFDRFMTRYDHDRERQDAELAETRQELRDTRSIFRIALKHINLLRSEMRRHEVPVPVLPERLEDVPWSLLGEDQSPS